MSMYNRLLSCGRVGVVVVTTLGLSLSAYASDTASEKAVEAVAVKVEKKAEQSEKAEGSTDLVEDTVTVKKNAQGQPVIEQKGEASWYGKDFHGKETASGERFNQHDMTAAHPTLPLGTEAKVTNLQTGKTVEVEINDRGPYTKGRDLDLSKAAATELGVTNDGAAPVQIEAEVQPQNAEEKKD